MQNRGQQFDGQHSSVKSWIVVIQQHCINKITYLISPYVNIAGISNKDWVKSTKIKRSLFTADLD